MVGVISPPLPLSKDMLFRLSLISSVTTPVNMSALVSNRPNSVPYVINNAIGPVVHSGNRTRETFTEPTGGGFLWRLGTGTPGGVKRGQMYGEIGLEWRGGGGLSVGSGYISQTAGLKTGFFENSLEGKGFLSWVQIANDVAGDVVTTALLAASNARRKIIAVLVKYESSGDTATRLLTVDIRDVADVSGPTGFSIDEIVYKTSSVSLVANEQGMIYIAGNWYRIANDNGSITIANNATTANPLPIWVDENDTAALVVTATDGESADRYDAFVQMEEWVES